MKPKKQVLDRIRENIARSGGTGKRGGKQTGQEQKRIEVCKEPRTADQLTDLETAQQNQQKTKRPIDSTAKSKQNLKHKLKEIHSSEDVKEEH